MRGELLAGLGEPAGDAGEGVGAAVCGQPSELSGDLAGSRDGGFDVLGVGDSHVPGEVTPVGAVDRLGLRSPGLGAGDADGGSRWAALRSLR